MEEYEKLPSKIVKIKKEIGKEELHKTKDKKMEESADR